MNFTMIIIFVSAFAVIVGAVLLIKQSAKKFELSKEQWSEVKLRAKEQQEKDKQKR
jgi:positive regulator of sigma E activity